ncbi:hypothetical protein [Enterovibrio norvegicus]|uniref:hypothetical protein n=1 Tax=Enterovibrio norvegicus TaxID=188144 RepID=UPI00352D966B
MKSWIVATLLFTLAGCQNTLKIPESDYQGQVPDSLNEHLLALNEEPIYSSRGATIRFIYEEDKALLTISRKLKSSRWGWDMNKSDVADDIRARTCEQFGDAINQGLGVRHWYVGAFVTETISAGDCD